MMWLKKTAYMTVCSMTAIMLTACATGSPVRDFCLLYTPVYTHADDTDVTRDAADRNNAVWLEMCSENKF